jgi:glycosyltransferase involved in cell wall biosynthesis
MAAAKPVVLAGNNDGYRSVLQRAEQLFRPSDAAELADKLVMYLQDNEARKQAVAWQTNHVQQFDVSAVGAQLLDTYRKICGIKS